MSTGPEPLTSAVGMLVEPPEHGRGHFSRVQAPPWLRQPMQSAHQATQAAQDATTLGALLGVAVHPNSRSRPEFLVEVLGHVAGSPAMIAFEAQTVQKAAHAVFDPIRFRRGSHNHLLP